MTEYRQPAFDESGATMRIVPTEAEIMSLRDALEWEKRRGAEARAANTELRRLLIAHHAAGALDGVLIGDPCPICERAGND